MVRTKHGVNFRLSEQVWIAGKSIQDASCLLRDTSITLHQTCVFVLNLSNKFEIEVWEAHTKRKSILLN